MSQLEIMQCKNCGHSVRKIFDGSIKHKNDFDKGGATNRICKVMTKQKSIGARLKKMYYPCACTNPEVLQ